MPNASYFWLLIGAFVGMFFVFAIDGFALYQLASWQAALVTALSATIFGGVGPKIWQPSDREIPHAGMGA